MLQENSDISTQVILFDPKRNILTEKEITHEKIGDFIPDKNSLLKVLKIFESNGFHTDPAFGISFAISGPVSLFEKFFKLKITEDASGNSVFIDKRKKKTNELKGDMLPDIISKDVYAVVFTKQPDFGPGKF